MGDAVPNRARMAPERAVDPSQNSAIGLLSDGGTQAALFRTSNGSITQLSYVALESVRVCSAIGMKVGFYILDAQFSSKLVGDDVVGLTYRTTVCH